MTMRTLFVITLFPSFEVMNTYVRHVAATENSPYCQYTDLRNRIDTGRIMKIPFLTLNISVECLIPLKPEDHLYIPSYLRISRRVDDLFYNRDTRYSFMEKINEISQIIISELTQDFDNSINPSSWRVETYRYYDSEK